MNTTMMERETADPSAIRTQGKRLNDIALALVLIMTGALWLAPRAMFPDGAWLAGVGLILLGLNAARRLHGIETSSFGIIVGLVAFAAGTGRVIGLDLPFVPALMIVIGAVLVVKAAISSGKTEGESGAL